ncbi:MAG: class I SAM-dependent methyltransferase [Aurantibacter sp.]
MAVEAIPWYYDDKVWTLLTPKFNTEEHWQMAIQDIRQIVKLIKPPVNATVLDLGCGPGRHSMQLAKQGFKVTSLDRTQSYLDILRNKALAANLKINMVQDDMKDFVRKDAFDLIVSLNSSFGYFESRSDHLQVLKNVHESLRPGGSTLFELYGKEVVAKSFVEKEWTEIDGIYFLDDRKVDGSWGRVTNNCKIISNGKLSSVTFSLTIFSGDEFSRMLKKVGFSKVKLYGSLEGIPYNNYAKRLVAVGIK